MSHLSSPAFYVVAFVKPLSMGVQTHPARQGRFLAITRCVTISTTPTLAQLAHLPDRQAPPERTGDDSGVGPYAP